MQRIVVFKCLVGATLVLGATTLLAEASTPRVLVLITEIPPTARARGNTPVFLEERDAQGCRLVGVLTATIAPDVTVGDRFLSLVLNSSARWQINIKRQECGDLIKDVALTVRVPRFWADEFASGRQVLAR